MSYAFHPGTQVGDGLMGNLLESSQGYSSESDDVSISAPGEIMPCRSGSGEIMPFRSFIFGLIFNFFLKEYTC